MTSVSKLNFSLCDWNMTAQTPEISAPIHKCDIFEKIYLKGILLWMYLPTLGAYLTPITVLSKHLTILVALS